MTRSIRRADARTGIDGSGGSGSAAGIATVRRLSDGMTALELRKGSLAFASRRWSPAVLWGLAGVAAVREAGIKRLKGTWWMPWHREAMKDVARCEKPRGVASKL